MGPVDPAWTPAAVDAILALHACPGTVWGTASNRTAKSSSAPCLVPQNSQAITPPSVVTSGGPPSACLIPPSHQCAAAASASPGVPSNPKIAE